MNTSYQFLGDLIHIKHGYAFKSEYFSLDNGEKIVLTPGNFNEEGGFKLRPDKDRFYTGNYPLEFILKKNDLIIAMTEQTYGLLGSPALIPENNKYLHNQRLGKFEIIKKDKIDLKYIYYLFFIKSIRDEISISATGTKIRHTSPERVYKLKIPLPSLPIQRKIAAVLSTYDDLIENNNRRIAILEKMAEELYREWFVRLRFPGHEKVKIVKGVPEGWEVKSIGECFTTYLGGTPSREVSSYWGGNIPWINSGEINKQRIIHETEFITELGYSKSATRMMPVHTTVLAITGATLGQVSFTELEVCANQSVVGICDEKDIYNYYVFGYIKSTIQNIIAKQGGGGQQHINKDIVEKEQIILPDVELINDYNKISSPIFKQIANKYFSNKKLTFFRDRLLSRLMSGKIDIENMDIEFPASMREEEAVNA